MFEQVFTGGIFIAIIAATWNKIRDMLWYFAEFFICRFNGEGIYSKYASVYIWNKLKNKPSFAPIYNSILLGSGNESRIFIREVGFKNFRLVWFGKIPALCTIDVNCQAHIYGIKPFLNDEKIMHTIIEYYNIKYNTNEKSLREKRFYTEYIRGSLNKYNHQCSPAKGRGDVVTVDSTDPPIEPGLSFMDMERFNIGRRVNYDAETYRQYATFTKKNVTLLDNLYLSDKMLDMKKKLEQWFNNKDWFIDRCIQWKRGFLLHGVPGTGKTSIITALGEYFGVPVYIFDLSTFTNEDFHEEWTRIKSFTPCFVVFEDFDSVFDGRVNVYSKHSMQAQPLSFDCVLNVLDGAVKYDGVVTFITTNNFDKIDSALGGKGCTRPGRIDYVYEMDNIQQESKQFIANKILEGLPNYKELTEMVLSDTRCVTAAQFKELCIDKALSTYNTIN